VRLPTGSELPPYIKQEFAPFYRDMFRTAVARESGDAVFLEYAWDTGWCDPCAADPLTEQEFRELGVFWLDEQMPETQPELWPPGWSPRPSGVADVFVTRLHVRYDGEHFPDDLVFQETGDRESFQGRFVLRHPWRGKEASCEAAKEYLRRLPERAEVEAQTLANLTGWDIEEIRQRTGYIVIDVKLDDQGSQSTQEQPWWRRLWD
jgi:hypothetical protein